jgi:uncharacterized protein
MNLHPWEFKFKERLLRLDTEFDPAHDLAHLQRVVTTAKALALKEKAQLEVVVPAAWLHDWVNLPKNDPQRTKSSTLSASAAVEYLNGVGYPACYFDEIYHSIQAHSFSAAIRAETLEAQIVQDADRIDAIGAIGIARCLTVGGALKRRIYDPKDPFAQRRPPDDSKNTIDHVYCRLLKIKESLWTQSGKEEAGKRVEFMVVFLEQLKAEIG